METHKDRIEKVMELEELNASQFAYEIGVKSPTLSHILNGRNNPSLDVLTRILERYRTISSDWLILGVGQMQRGIKHSPERTLFDDVDETESKSSRYDDKTTLKSSTDILSIQRKTDQIDSDSPKSELHPHAIQKLVKKIIVYYDDNTFQELSPNQ